MNIFGIGLPEMAVIAAIGLLVFGPKRLPELGKTLGRTLRGFQSASQEFEQEFRSAIAPSEAAASSSAPASPVPGALVEPAAVLAGLPQAASATPVSLEAHTAIGAGASVEPSPQPAEPVG
jgi:sec-independent protein translocase protein TatA